MADLIIKPLASPSTLSESGLMLEDSETKVQEAFRKLAQRDMIAVKHSVLEALAQEIEEVTLERPELNAVEVLLVAKKVLKQRIACYMGALDQLL